MTTLTVREVGSRLHLRWRSDTSREHERVLAAFRSRFQTHGAAIWNETERCWSLPYTEAERLKEWIARPDFYLINKLVWVHEETPAKEAAG